MAAVNSVQNSLHSHCLSGLNSPRVLMCSASVGSEGSVTLQLRDANSTDSQQSSTSAVLDNALTIGYPDSDMLADVLGTLQTACNSLKNNNNNSSNSSSNILANRITVNSNNNNCINKAKLQIKEATHTVSTSTSTTNRCSSNSNNHRNCSTSISRSNSIGNIHLANVQTMSCSTAADILSNSNNNINSSNSNCSNSSISSNSNFSSSNSNDSLLIVCGNSTANIACLSSSSSSSNSINNNKQHVPGSSPPSIVKKSRPKISSPTRHGPQQCQVCSKVFGNASALAKHKLTHSDERKYVCAMCSKAFKRQDHLNGHMMTHRNKKPYECKAEGCGKSYCDARSLRRHTENHHAAAAAAAAAATPQNQSLSPTTGTPIGLSLSPATASGDASSPDGATCIRTYFATAGSVVDAQTGVMLSEEQLKSINVKGAVTVLSPSSSNSSSSVSVSSPISITETNLEGEGLTRQQLDLISQIMQQTKQSSAQITVSTSTNVNSYKVDTATTTSTTTAQSTAVQQMQSASINRPRTWNMQTQLNSSQKVSITVDNVSTTSTAMDSVDDKELQQSHQLVTAINPHLLNIVKIDQKPVECNLCHRKFKNIPALNGHMRLHGGYFKKDPEAKKAEKKDTSGPPLQTASIGVRALIEEKIINKRSKDLNKGAFAVPAPPSSIATNTIRRSASDLENFLTPKIHSSSVGALPAVTTIKNSSLSIQQIGLPQNIEIYSTKQQKTGGNISVGVGTTTATHTNAMLSPSASPTLITKSTSTDPKDSTLIELLKRGTRVAVATKRTQHSTNNLITTTTNNNSARSQQHQIIANNRAVVIPSELQVLSNKSSSAITSTASQLSTPLGLTLSETTPLSLTISQTTGSSGDIYTLTYSTDSTGLFDETEVYNVSDTEMLLQTVDSIELLNDAADQSQSVHSDQFSLTDNASSGVHSVEDTVSSVVTSLPDSLLDYQTFHSKELIMPNTSSNANCVSHTDHIQQVINMRPKPRVSEIKQLTTGAIISPMHSPLTYPTPPASHENVTQSSPFVDEGQHFVENANAFFSDKCNSDFLKDAENSDFFKTSTNNTVNDMTDNENILKLKSVLEESDFDTPIKVEDLLSGSDDTECDLREFAEQNLSFLDDDQEFLDDSGNATSPLSESFFTSGIGTAEEVKEVLREVLPDEHINGEAQSENVIDLYYLPGIGLQSHMMPNSEDPLLSSSPRDFGQQQRGQQQLQQMQHVQLQQQLYVPQLQQQQHQSHQQRVETKQSSQTSFIQLNGNEYPIMMTTATEADTDQTIAPLSFAQTQQFISSGNSTHQHDALATQYKDTTEMQPIIFTGSTDKEEIAINLQQSNLNLLPESGTVQVDDGSLYFNNNSTGATSINMSATIATETPTVAPTESIVLMAQSNSILKRRLRANDSSDSSLSVHNYSKYHAMSPYRSKLRKPTRTHYTPAPILNPDRKGVGLYSSMRRSFISGTLTFDSIADDFDDPIGLVDFSDDSKVNLGSAYQAQLPAFEACSAADSAGNVGEELMWHPRAQADEKLLMRYIEMSKSSAVPLGYHSEEVALKALLQASGNTHSAVLTLLQSQSNSFQLKWSANELEQFLQGLERHGKDFSTIATEITTKTTGECVQMYYFWKKLSVDYKVTHLKAERTSVNSASLVSQQATELRPHVCEMPDCSASFTSKAALHGHTRIHCYGRNTNNQSTSSATSSATSTSVAAQVNGTTAQSQGQSNIKDDFPCKVCGKVFNKVKSRSAHMKTHRIQDGGGETQPQLQLLQQHSTQMQQQMQATLKSQQQQQPTTD